MSTAAERSWRCAVCGYVQTGSAAPETCPVCGAPREDFEACPTEASPAGDRSATPQRWICSACAYLHVGARRPETCSVCGAGGDRFEASLEPGASAGAVPGDWRGHVVVIGAGIAGVSAVEAVLATAPGASISLLSRETDWPYYRLNLTRYLAGEIGVDSLPIHPEGWYRDHGVELRRGVEVRELVPSERRVRTADGVLEYDRLVLCTGAHPYVPPLPGVEREGVTSLRTAADADRILEAAAAGRPVVCIGGGVLGIETAGALARRGADVTLLESHGWLMPRQLNRKAGEVLRGHVESLGVRLAERARTAAIEGAVRLESVLLEDGRRIPAGLVVLATGVRPNTHLARRAGLEVDKGIVVGNWMDTSHEGIYAAGDAAEHNGQLYGVWGASQYQGTIAGRNAAGVPSAFGGLPRAHALKILGLDVASIGDVEPEDGSYRVVEDDAEGYCRFLFRDNRMVGAVVCGRPAVGRAARRAIEEGRDMSVLLAARPSGADVAADLEART